MSCAFRTAQDKIRRGSGSKDGMGGDLAFIGKG